MPNMPAAQSAETDLQREALKQTYSASAELSHSYNANRHSESLQQRQHHCSPDLVLMALITCLMKVWHPPGFSTMARSSRSPFPRTSISLTPTTPPTQSPRASFSGKSCQMTRSPVSPTRRSSAGSAATATCWSQHFIAPLRDAAAIFASGATSTLMRKSAAATMSRQRSRHSSGKQRWTPLMIPTRR